MSRLMLLASIGVLSAGCFSLQPAAGVAPELGSRVAFDINDAGRVALGPSMGTEIAQVGGRLVSRDSEEFVVSVMDVTFLRGGDAAWRGEEVRIKNAYVSTLYRRRFSPAKTIALGAVGLGAIAVLAGQAVTRGFPDTPPDTTPQNPSSRGRKPGRPIHAPFPPTP